MATRCLRGNQIDQGFFRRSIEHVIGRVQAAEVCQPPVVFEHAMILSGYAGIRTDYFSVKIGAASGELPQETHVEAAMFALAEFALYIGQARNGALVVPTQCLVLLEAGFKAVRTQNCATSARLPVLGAFQTRAANRFRNQRHVVFDNQFPGHEIQLALRSRRCREVWIDGALEIRDVLLEAVDVVQEDAGELPGLV